eukprot:GFYU01004971.1.p1 GENE.GFYU01004971.1~~GFYU01004971.1.p1  ORF type:complete len:255 (-),score=59.58 GFYU01004971.1:183-947(-)
MTTMTTTPTVAIFYTDGGLPDVAKHAVAIALRKGYHVRAIAKDPDCVTTAESVTQPELTNTENLTKIALDIRNIDASGKETLKAALRGVDAVLAAAWTRQPGKELGARDGMPHIVEVMEQLGISRIVMISSVGVSEDWPPMKWSWIGWCLFACMLRTCIRSQRRDLQDGEEVLRKSKLNYAIFRCIGVTPEMNSRGIESIRAVECNYNGTDMDMGMAKEDCGEFALQECLKPTIEKKSMIVGRYLAPGDKPGQN